MNSTAVKRRFASFRLTLAYGNARDAIRISLDRAEGRGSRVDKLQVINSSLVSFRERGKGSCLLRTELRLIEFVLSIV